MIVNFDRKFLFCHNEKAAGTSMSHELKSLSGNYHVATDFSKGPVMVRDVQYAPFTKDTGFEYPNKHMRMTQSAQLLNIDVLYKFAFVRHPKTKYLSLFLHTAKILSQLKTLTPQEILASPHRAIFTLDGKPFNFDFFLREFMDIGVMQTSWICDKNNNIMCDFVGKFENLNQDWKIVCERIGLEYRSLPHKNKSGLDDEVVNLFYTDDLLEFLFHKYSDDFEVFGYDKA